MTALENAKERLPLPELMAQLGLGDHAKKSARCPFHEDANASFSMFQKGNGDWAWKCHGECGVGGDEADFIAKHEGLTDSGDACRRYIELAGVRGSDKPTTAKRVVARSVPAPKESDPILPMPVAVSDAWFEGVNYVQGKPDLVQLLADERGWPASFVQHLFDDQTISMPLYFGSRGYAFQVTCPIGYLREVLVSLPIGWHIRKAEHRHWFYEPSEKSHGYGIPSLPFVVGEFDTAHTLIILEGAWDMLTFGLAAGWLGEGCRWPKGVGLVGIRGAENWGGFLKHYRQYWPKSANCLVLPDNDPKGMKWFTGERSFVAELSKLCRKVAVVKCGQYKDFNDMYKGESIGPEQIRELLKSHGMGLESAVLV